MVKTVKNRTTPHDWRKFKQKALDYIDGVLDGSIPASKWVKLAFERHKADLKNQKTTDFAYEFNEQWAEHPLRVFSILKHAKGKWSGRYFNLTSYFAAILWIVYGWRHLDSDRKRFRKVYVKVPRKNAKTENLAGVGIYGFGYEREHDPEVFWFATKKEQAKTGWDRQHLMTKRLISDSQKFGGFCETSTYRIFTKEGLGFVTYLGQDSKTEDSHAPYYAIGDEYHAHITNGMVNVMEDGMGSRESPMTWLITTAGYNIHGPCKKFEETCENILEGKIPGENIFCIMFGVDEEDRTDPVDGVEWWENPDVWRKANPAYDEIETLPPYLAEQCALAKTEGGEKIVSFLTKNLNEWYRASKTWMTDAIWMNGGSDGWTIDEMKGEMCFAAWDLSSDRDITCFGLLFPPNPAKNRYKFRFWAKYYIPEDNAEQRSRRDNVPYLDWAKNGKIVLTPGNWIDYDYIEADISSVLGRFDVKSIGYDRWQSNRTAQKFSKEGAPVQEFAQTVTQFNEPIRFMQKQISNFNEETGEQNSLLDHGNCPILRWMAGNVVEYRNNTGLIKFDKENSREKIDGMVVLGMCFGGYLDYLMNDKKKPYQETGIRYL